MSESSSSRKTFRLGEYVAHLATGRLGHVNGIGGSAGVYVYWEGVYHHTGPEAVAYDELISLDNPADGVGHFDQIRQLAALAHKVVDVIDTTAEDARDHGWYSGDLQPIFRALSALATYGDRIKGEVYRADAEGRN
ncbi:hypothetical protein ACWDTT_15910 [Streptosporangium sandarakinum]